MRIEFGYRKEKIADICADFGVAFSYKGSYPLKNDPGYWIWFPHFEKGYKSDYINQFSEDKFRIIVTPANENASTNMEKAFDDRLGKKFIVFPKLDDGFYTFSGVFLFSKEESTPGKEVYIKIADFYSDEPEPVAAPAPAPVKKSKAKKVIIATAVAATATSSALFGLKFCSPEKYIIEKAKEEIKEEVKDQVKEAIQDKVEEAIYEVKDSLFSGKETTE